MGDGYGSGYGGGGGGGRGRGSSEKHPHKNRKELLEKTITRAFHASDASLRSSWQH